ncbi:MAG: hypothetical protein ACJA1A_003220 [Saprospiraceae bacterium]|jgi:hypothetical protein
MIRIIITLSFLILGCAQVVACSCVTEYWCDYIDSGEEIVAFKGTAYNHQFNGGGILLTYFIIDEVFREDQVIGDSIVLIGREFEAGCDVNVHKRFEVGKQYYIAYYSNEPGSAIASNFNLSWISNFSPSLCAMTYLRVEDVNVKGGITPNITEYPKDEFDKHVKDCSYSIEELNQARCKQGDYTIAPNPNQGSFLFRGNYLYTAIEKVEVYRTNGELVRVDEYTSENNQYLQYQLNESGVYLLRIYCCDLIYVEKVVVL